MPTVAMVALALALPEVELGTAYGTPALRVRGKFMCRLRTDPDALYVSINDRDKAWHDLYKVKISTGERTLLRKNTERRTGWEFDLKDQLSDQSYRWTRADLGNGLYVRLTSGDAHLFLLKAG